MTFSRLRLVALPLLLVCIPAQAQSPSADTAATDLDAVRVVGRRDSGAYYADETSGSKTHLPLRELPQSVRVLSRQTIDDLGATRLDDTLDYVGGISRQNDFGGLWDNFAVRGLPGSENTGSAMLRNGLAGNRGYNAPRDTANLERIEFLKGPAAALYGSSEPGGTINLVTKAPQWRRGTAVELYAGNRDRYRAVLDTTGPLGDAFAYRLNAAAEEGGSVREHVRSRRAFLAPAFTWRLGEATTLEYDGEWLRHEVPLDRGVLQVDGRLGAVPRERFLGEPADGDIRVDNRTHQLVLDHEWAEGWSGRIAASRRTTALRGLSTEPSALQADGRTLWRQRRHRDYASEDTVLQAELRAELATGALRHDLLVGVETYDYAFDQHVLRVRPSAAEPYALDLLQPVYGQPQPAPLPFIDTRETQRNRALYLQDAIGLGERWRLLLGLRRDDHRQTLYDHRLGTRHSQSPSATSPRLGLSWLPDAHWTIYANAGKSFRPNNGADVWGGSDTRSPPAPETGRALELGAKWQAADGRLGGTLALFDIVKRNVLTGDPDNEGQLIAAGRVRSRGAELDFAGQVTEHWRANASVSFNDVEVVEDNTLQPGRSLINVPRVNASLLAVYERALGGGLYGIGGGLTHTGARPAEAYTRAQAEAGVAPSELPAYTVAKLTAYWRPTSALRLSLDVDNVFDRTYYTSSVAATPWVSVGEARTLTLGAQWRF
ncbi:TonB-dependent siderophore receptor [Luteimonas salinilitoris]|uniref:TonB-dependent siderophore receptor n=1 Tax=Luteimonas salinilitoris TaxID=3237697 RepID=A0ABV4HS90_9GAMM